MHVHIYTKSDQSIRFFHLRMDARISRGYERNLSKFFSFFLSLIRENVEDSA